MAEKGLVIFSDSYMPYTHLNAWEAGSRVCIWQAGASHLCPGLLYDFTTMPEVSVSRSKSYGFSTAKDSKGRGR